MKHNPRETALRRAETGRNVAAAIRDAIYSTAPDDAQELAVYAHRVHLCNSNGNIWLANDLHNQDGECFDGSGRFWNCGSKLCPSCVARQSKRNRNNVREALRLQKLKSGESFKFITLTMPNLGLSLQLSRTILIEAFQLLRKRKWWIDTVLGAARSEEFTVTAKGIHYHMHLIAKTRYVWYNKLRSEWTECIMSALANNDQPTTIASVDGLAVANCKQIYSLDNAVKEVAKYVTKSDSWAKLRHEDLLEVARIRRFPRMFELLGDFKKALLASAVDEEDLGLDERYLDTTSFTDGNSRWDWRDELNAVGVAAYLETLRDEITEKSNFRIDQLKHRYPVATFSRLKAPPMPNAEAVLSFLDRVSTGCPECGKPHSWHDYDVKFANHCGLVIA